MGGRGAGTGRTSGAGGFVWGNGESMQDKYSLNAVKFGEKVTMTTGTFNMDYGVNGKIKAVEAYGIQKGDRRAAAFRTADGDTKTMMFTRNSKGEWELYGSVGVRMGFTRKQVENQLRGFMRRK